MRRRRPGRASPFSPSTAVAPAPLGSAGGLAHRLKSWDSPNSAARSRSTPTTTTMSLCFFQTSRSCLSSGFLVCAGRLAVDLGLLMAATCRPGGGGQATQRRHQQESADSPTAAGRALHPARLLRK